MSQFKKFENFPAAKAELTKLTKREVTLRCLGAIFGILTVLLVLAYVICLNARISRLEEVIDQYPPEGNYISDKSDLQESNVTKEPSLRQKRGAGRRHHGKRRYRKKYGCSLVTGTRSAYLPRDRIFRWSRANPLADCSMRTLADTSGGIRQIRIQENGLYYIYAQLTYTENPLIPNVEAPMGGQIYFEIIMHDVDAVPVPRDVVLMRSLSHTRPSTNTPTPTSSHVGGLHRLFINQVIYVRERTPSRKYSMRPEENYFGVFLVERGP